MELQIQVYCIFIADVVAGFGCDAAATENYNHVPSSLEDKVQKSTLLMSFEIRNTAYFHSYHWYVESDLVCACLLYYSTLTSVIV